MLDLGRRRLTMFEFELQLSKVDKMQKYRNKTERISIYFYSWCLTLDCNLLLFIYLELHTSNK